MLIRCPICRRIHSTRNKKPGAENIVACSCGAEFPFAEERMPSPSQQWLSQTFKGGLLGIIATAGLGRANIGGFWVYCWPVVLLVPLGAMGGLIGGAIYRERFVDWLEAFTDRLE